MDVPVELQPLVRQLREELMLDGIRLADLGATEVDVSEEIDFVVLNALQLKDTVAAVTTRADSCAAVQRRRWSWLFRW